MSGIAGTPGLGMQGGLALRAHILERSAALQQANRSAEAAGAAGAGKAAAGGFTATMHDALQAVNNLQSTGGEAAARWERGETSDIAAVMLSRQKASLAFEATLQTRNRLLTAYRDIMNMPV